ncbi:MAG TPA: restriction endonuclease [Gallicola sp.]|nr:restriction endonuclease [Gallicola sp.]
MKQGTEYEIFVEQVYQLLKEDKKYTIDTKRNLIIKGKSGADHEIDVYWEFSYHGKVYKTAIECKDYKTAISKGKIQEFYGKLIDLPEKYEGVFATKIGYQKGAKKYANQYNIDALVINELTEDNFPEGYIRQINFQLNIVGNYLTDINFEFDKEWIKNNCDLPFKAHIMASGDNILIEDETNKIYNSFNQYVNTEGIIKNREKIDNDKSRVSIDIDNGFMIDTTQNLKLKILKINYVENHYSEEEEFTIDGLKFAFALIKRVSTGEFIFVKKI